MKYIKEKINEGKTVVGTWLSLAHPGIAEIMAKSGFDWVAIDLEHSCITIREAEELIRVIELCGAAPLVRLTSNNPDQIKRVMDSGSHGVIVPMVNSKLDAENAVKAVKYPPLGSRGFGLARAQGYGTGFKEYVNWQEKGSLIIVQIEHIQAVQAIHEIFSTPGIDGYIIGPYDLSGSMGLPGQLDHPEVLNAIELVHTAAKNYDLVGGIHLVEPDPVQLKQLIDAGSRFIAYSVDIRILSEACRIGVNVFKGE